MIPFLHRPQATAQIEPPCPACGCDQFSAFFTKGGRSFWRCTCCGALKQAPLPTLDELAAHYDDSYRSGQYKGFTEAAQVKGRTAGYRFARIVEHCRLGRWLDIGCSDGRFVQEARTHGIDAYGVEFSSVAAADARAKGAPVIQTTIEDYRPDEPFDTLTAFDVIEHVIDPPAFLRAAHRLLVPEGRLVLTLPNIASLTARLMGRHWYFYVPEEHLHYFDPSSIRRLLDRHGLETLRVEPIGKPLTFAYGLTQFREYNPLLYRLLAAISLFLPNRLLQRVIPFRIGEMLVIAKPRPHAS
jgi:2-polyprenyl-3-methyl-5-hydroxy-6-metoxy-1,4-benzoquinol methylase